MEEAPGHGGWSGIGAPPALEGGVKREGTWQNCTGTRDGMAHGQESGSAVETRISSLDIVFSL
eukprot:848201-Ditylum_brightwellii.AAC.1